MAKRPTVLVADDETQNLSAMSRILQKEGVDIITASDGLEAYNLVCTRHPDIVITDVMMPHMDGFELCRKIKTSHDTIFMPVVLTTALDDLNSRLTGISAGADDYLNKPINAAELTARVRAALRIRRAHDALENAEKTMGWLAEYAESILRSFNPITFNPLEMEYKLVSQVLFGPVADRNRPAGVLVGKPTETGGYKGRFYYSSLGEVRLFFESATINPPSTPDKCRPAVGMEFGNYDPQGTRNAIPKELLPITGALKNFGAVTNGGAAVVAVNLQDGVSRFDVDILKNLIIYLVFFENLAGEVRRTDDAFQYTVDSLVRAAEANDEDTGNHILRVNEYAKLLAIELGLSETLVEEIYRHAQIHDVGKLHIDRSILRKPGPLNRDEWQVMRRHPLFGARILGGHPRFDVARNIALTHHERYDGSGYPNGLKGEEIPIEGRIVMIADIYDALRCRRSYKDPIAHLKAVEVILNGDDRTSPSHFDPMVVSAFNNRAAELDFFYSRMV